MNSNELAQAQDNRGTLIAYTAEVVAAHVSNNSVSSDQVAALIGSVYNALAGLGSEVVVEERPDPAVSVRASVKSDHLVCLEDGKKMKMLKRHLMTDHGMSPEEYRARWNLPASYPMVAPDYAEKRRALAMRIGLGRKPGERPGAKKAATRQPAAKARSTKPSATEAPATKRSAKAPATNETSTKPRKKTASPRRTKPAAEGSANNES